jgi:DNA-binding NarL/FixJ family response regulator
LIVYQTRILVVDDIELWRQLISSMLHARPGFQVIDEASDGVEAVQKAEELKPDLILLDIGLPGLNGIEAARRIHRVSPNSKILFASENQSSDVVEEALRTGGGGYVLKSSAARDLLPAVEAILEGEQFISASLVGHDRSSSKYENAVESRRYDRLSASMLPGSVSSHHEVEFYADDAGLVDGFARVADTALKLGNVAVVIATEAHRTGILQKLRRESAQLGSALQQGYYIALDVFDVLSKCMVNDLPDPALCAMLVGDLIRGAARGTKGPPPQVAICGECAPTLLFQGQVEAAIQLERVWDEVTKPYSAGTLCGYVWSAVPHQEGNPVLEQICAEHSGVRDLH